MKTASMIKARIQELLLAELDDRVTEAGQRLPHLCVHNHRQPVDTRRRIDDEPNPGYNRVNRRHLPVLEESLGLCMYGSEDKETWPGDICEDPIDAQRCPLFTSLLNKDLVHHQFMANLADLNWRKANMPEVHILLGVLADEANPQVLRLPWWKRLWFWALRIKVEPQVIEPPLDLTLLLPPASEDQTP